MASSKGEKSGEAIVESADSIESRRFRTRRRLERRGNHRGVEYERPAGLSGAQAIGGRRVRGGIEPQATDDSGNSANFRRRERTAIDRLGVLHAAEGLRALDIATAGKEGSRIGNRRIRQRQHDQADAKKMLNPRVKEQWVIPPQENSAFVAAMEDVLDVYQRPRDPIRPSIRCVSTRRSTPSRGAVPGFIRARLRMGWLPAGRGCGWM